MVGGLSPAFQNLEATPGLYGGLVDRLNEVVLGDVLGAGARYENAVGFQNLQGEQVQIAVAVQRSLESRT